MLIRTGLLACCIFFSPFHVKAINRIIEVVLEPVISYDELSINCVVNDYLRFETDIVISESNKVYISIEDLFRNLSIKCIPENEGNQLNGFIENENNTYSLDFNVKQITIGNRTIKSENGFIKESGSIYVETTIITEAFGFNILFNYRSLSMKMEINFELPVIKKLRLEQMRLNVSNLQNKSVLADTIVPKEYHLFKFGMIDWSLNSTQTTNELINNSVRVGLGAELLYGEVNVSAYYNDQIKFDEQQLYYRWRFVDNNKKYIKQAQVGKIHTQTIAFINSSVIGATINNSPTTVRKASGFYTINEYTEPNWMVELYINDILVDYTTADAAGFYMFKIPIVYGYNSLKLKFYGPLGEERTDERTMNTPYTFMPAKTLEYSVSGGVLQDGAGSSFGKGVLNYGVNRILTVGGGVEHLSSLPNNPYIPFANLAIQPISKMVLNLEYAYGVRTTGMLNYTFGQSAFLEIDYAKYKEGQLVTRFNADEERKAKLSIPYKIKKVSGYWKLNFQQSIYDAFTSNRFDAVFSAYYKNYNANLSILNSWETTKSAYSTANLSLSYRLRNGLVIRPSAVYNITDNIFVRYRAEIEKRVAKMYFSVSFERNILSQTNNFFLSFSYDLPFARVAVSAAHHNNDFYFSENAQGSLAFGGDNNYVKASNTSSVGKGGILFYPFLDLNQNGVKDNGEQMILLSKVQVSGGKAIISKKDTIVRVSDLNAFIDYTVEFSDYNLDNIAWRFKNNTYSILVDPNQYKRVDIPIISVGEISGMVYLNNNNSLDGIGRITIEIYDKQGNKVVEILSERDGYFSYLGLNPNDYVVRIDQGQLAKLGYQSEPLVHNATINESLDGDILDGLDFVLKTEEKRTVISRVQQNVVLQQLAIASANIIKDTKEINSEDKSTPSILKDANSKLLLNYDTIDFAILESPIKSNVDYSVVWGNICDKPGNYYVQCGAFKKKSNALNFALKIKQTTDFAVGVLLADDYYKVQVGCLNNENKANEIKVELIKQFEMNDIFINAWYYNSFNNLNYIDDHLKK